MVLCCEDLGCLRPTPLFMVANVKRQETLSRDESTPGGDLGRSASSVLT